MNTTLELLRAVELSRDEVHALNRLSFGDRGSIIYELDDAIRYGETNARVVRLTDEAGRIISWGLVRKRRRTDKWDFQCYTRSTMRRKGYGTAVYRKAVQVAHGRHNMFVHPHDSRARGFFDYNHFDKEGYVRTTKPEFRKQIHKDEFKCP